VTTMTRMSFCGQLARMRRICPRSSGVTKKALRVSRDMRELTAGLADRRRVDERQDPIHVVGHCLIEQPLVPLLQRRQQHVPVDVARQPIQVRHHAVDHLSLGGHAVRKQSPQAQTIPLLPSEHKGSIERLVAKDVEAAFMVFSSRGRPPRRLARRS